MCTKSLGEIFLNMNIDAIYGKLYTPEELALLEKKDIKVLTAKDLNSWYIYSVGTNYSILKMRGYEEAKKIAEEQGSTKIRGIGTSIPFMEFDISLINSVRENFSQDIQYSQDEFDLYTGLDKLIYGKVDANHTYCVPIAGYFSNTSSKGSYLIAEEYIQKMLANETDENGYINVQSDIKPEQINVINKLPDGYDSQNRRFKVNSKANNCYNLTYIEKKAIIASRLGNKSINAYVAENIMHAVATITLGNFLQSDKEEIEVEVENEDTNETEIKEIDRSSAGNWFDSAIKSDAGIGEDPVPFKEAFVAFIYYPSLASKFGDV